VTADWPDFNPSAHRAAAIYSQTVPLAAKSTVLGQANTTVIAASGNAILGPFLVDQIGYEVSIDVGADVASANPFMIALMTWTDSVTNRVTEQQRWQLAGASGGTPNTYYGVGPSSGDTLTITLTNNDAVKAMTYAFVLASNSRAYVRHDWRNFNIGTVPTFTNANYDQAGQFLCQSAPTVGAGASTTRLLPLYCGKVRIWATFNQAYDLVISAIDRTIGIAPAGNQIWEQNVTNAAGGIIVNELALPRCTCTVSFTNNGAALSQFGFTMVASEQQP
jgi:hypothetical protein